jgi:hypothetical protein
MARKCVRCGREGKIERHHIKFRSRGGSDKPSNLLNLCKSCHIYLHTRDKILQSLVRNVKMFNLLNHRLEVLDKLNSVEVFQKGGNYQSYWTDKTTHYKEE